MTRCATAPRGRASHTGVERPVLTEFLTATDRAAPPSGGILPRFEPATPAGAGAWRFTVVWAVGWALAGSAVAAGIAFSRGSSDFGPLLLSSLLFAEVVGCTALVSARLGFPVYSKPPFPPPVRPQILTLRVGTAPGAGALL